jgi:hypothetical protein
LQHQASSPYEICGLEVEKILEGGGKLTLIPDAYGGGENLMAQLIAAENDDDQLPPPITQ